MMRAACLLLVAACALGMAPAYADPPLSLSVSSSRSELSPGDLFSVVMVVTDDGQDDQLNVTINPASVVQSRLELIDFGSSYAGPGAFEGLTWAGPVNEGTPVLIWFTFRVPDDFEASGVFYKLIWSATDDQGREVYAATVIRVGIHRWPPAQGTLRLYLPVFRG